MRMGGELMDAVDLHSQIAADFDAKYASSPMFRERLAVWREIIGGCEGRFGDVLDAGCGSGVLSVLAAKTARRVVGFDGSPAMIELARRNAGAGGATNCELEVARLGEAGLLAGQTFDLVLCSSVLEYVEDYWREIDWLVEHLAPRGSLVFSMPNGASFYRLAEALAYRVTGRPRYYAYVKNVPAPSTVLSGLRERRLAVRSLQFYGAPPPMPDVARPQWIRRRADTLFVVVCERMAGA